MPWQRWVAVGRVAYIHAKSQSDGRRVILMGLAVPRNQVGDVDRQMQNHVWYNIKASGPQAATSTQLQSGDWVLVEGELESPLLCTDLEGKRRALFSVVARSIVPLEQSEASLPEASVRDLPDRDRSRESVSLVPAESPCSGWEIDDDDGLFDAMDVDEIALTEEVWDIYNAEEDLAGEWYEDIREYEDIDDWTYDNPSTFFIDDLWY